MSVPPGHQPRDVVGGRYRIVRRIGQGGMGRVYVAEDLRRNCEWVAVKENIDQASDARERVLDEIAILLGCDHPGLPRFISRFAEADGRLYLVMSYIRGINLDTVRAREVVDERAAIAWIARLCEILTYLHTMTDPRTGRLRPIAHRDVKPGNIILRGLPADVVLVDFGIACRAEERRAGCSSGYSPPEQWDENAPADPRSDIFSAGATLLYLLTACEPPDNRRTNWTAELTDLVAAAVANPSLRRVILRAMQHDPAHRYPSAEALAGDLLKCQWERV